MKRKKKLIKYITIFIFLFALGFLLSYLTLPRNLRYKLENMRMVSEVYDCQGKLIGNLFSHRRIWTPSQKISPYLKKAVIAIEDARFYHHPGIDPIGISRAVYQNLRPGGVKQGGSTITQQLAKISLLSSERTVYRKIQDMLFALLIERTYTKEEILELYLNSIYLAHGNIGVEAAARYYFGKSVSSLNLEESALLAGVIRSPENYSPFKHPETAKARRDLVLKKLWEQNYITESQYKTTITKGLGLISKQEASSAGGYFLDYIRDLLIKEEGFSEEELYWGGYKIYTTLNLNYQKEAEKVMKSLPHYSGKIQPEAALITLDPTNGGILAMTGGRDYTQTQLNRSVKSYRQPGSALKPFVFATALEQGYTAASIFEDQPVSIHLENGEEWSPENYDHEYKGRINLRQALRESINTTAVQLVQSLGIPTVANQMKKMGINSLITEGKNNDLNYAPLALGGLTRGVTPLELATAYTSFANGGNYLKPYAITKILNNEDKVIKEFKPGNGNPVISPQTAYIMTMLMKDVIDNGTGWRGRLPNRPSAGKTGTTSDYTNAWFVGYTPQLLTTVWLGNDRQDQPMRYKEGVIGSGKAVELWGTYMKRITANLPVLDFVEPSGIVWANIDPETGLAIPAWINKNSYKEVFAETNIPESGVYKIWRWFSSWPKRKGKKEEPPVPENEVVPDEAPPENRVIPEHGVAPYETTPENFLGETEML